jgi:CheY-like chemotaxis protein
MAVLGQLGLARRRLAGALPEIARHLEAANEAAQRGATLTQRLLAFARRQDLRPVPVDLSALLDDVKGLLDRSVGPLVEVEIRAQPGLPPAQVDPHALDLALLNLAVNARDAMAEGGRLVVEAALADGQPPQGLPTGRWLTISVTDTGHGMDQETLKRAIEPFFTTKRAGQGTGLGLSMVHGLAAQSGGTLLIRSAPGQGTTATLWLPVSSGEAAGASLPREPELRTGTATVLFVDDEQLVLDSAAEMAEELGYRVLRAASGEEAVAAVEAHPEVALVVSDYAMPGMTGVALAAVVAERWPDLPFLLATGHAGPWPEGEGTPIRLAKPFSLGQLSDALAVALERRGAG